MMAGTSLSGVENPPPNLTDVENQHPNLTLTEDQMKVVASNPKMQSVCFEHIKKKMRTEEKEKIKKALTEAVKEATEGMQSQMQTMQSQMQSQMQTMQSQIATLISKQEDQATQLEDLATQLSYLTGIVCHMNTLKPTICIALYESAIYKFVESVIPDNNPNRRLICHQMVRLCNVVMVCLRSDFNDEDKKKMELKPVPNTVGNNQEDGIKQAKIRAVLAALQGMMTFIKQAPNDEIKAWNYESRNQIMHGWRFLDCLLASSDDDDGDLAKYKAEVAQVKNLEDQFRTAVEKRGYVAEESDNISIAVMEIRTLLENAGIGVVTEKAAKQLVKKVNHAISEPDDSVNKCDDGQKAASTTTTTTKNGKGKNRK